MALPDAFQHHLSLLRLARAKALVAVSGGPDSVALLDLLVRSSESHGLELVVAHVDHGIHPDSGRVAEAVEALAASYGLPCEVGQLRLGAEAGETLARVARYAWLDAARHRAGAEYILTAHHADDQVETVLMRALRGSGPAGLAAMAPRRGVVVRPLLPFRRVEIAAYAEAAGLAAWSDPANTDPRHLRSWLRGELLPVIRSRIPEIDRHLTRVASQAARDRAAWDTVLDAMPALAFHTEIDGVSMNADWLGSADVSLADTLLLAAARRAGCRLGPGRLARIRTLLQAGTSGASVPLGGRWRAERSFGRLHLVAVRPLAAGEPWVLEGEAGEGWWGRWHFRWSHEPAPDLQPREGCAAWFASGDGGLVVRRWVPGERIRPMAGAGGRPVVRCLQEMRVPRWRRAAWPLVTQPDPPGGVVWVPGICRSDTLVPPVGADALRVDVEYV